jgi:hypothetical protein
MPNLRTMTAAVRVELAAASTGLVRRVLSLCSALVLGSSIIIVSPQVVGRMIRPEEWLKNLLDVPRSRIDPNQR